MVLPCTRDELTLGDGWWLCLSVLMGWQQLDVRSSPQCPFSIPRQHVYLRLWWWVADVGRVLYSQLGTWADGTLVDLSPTHSQFHCCRDNLHVPRDSGSRYMVQQLSCWVWVSFVAYNIQHRKPIIADPSSSGSINIVPISCFFFLFFSLVGNDKMRLSFLAIPNRIIETRW
jgi:hypothetical protein